MANEHELRAKAQKRECSRHVVTACRYIDAHYERGDQSDSARWCGGV